ncbi:MAG: hypothetical protein BWK79_08225 [Beggiatoa sp. IS2]|nr:MAG: hypothetical protein BWK79_08225 [Beggiatoa sp. IS2]
MRYKYQALDTQGQEVSGILTAEAERAAIRQLQKRGLTTLVLAPLNAASNRAIRQMAKPKHRDILAVLHELATLLESGVSLIEAVESLAQSSHPLVITQTFADIATQLRHGITFSAALRASPLKLPWYLTHLLEAGELTGKVAEALRDGVEQMEYETRVNDEMRNAMIYPTILIVSGIAAILTIFIVVVPRFASILQNRSMTEIPFLAKLVLGAGMFLNTHLAWIIGTLLVFVIVTLYFLKQPLLRARLRDTLAHLPIIGQWLLEAETARWAAMMSTLLGNRVSLLRSLELACQGIKLPSLNARLVQVSKAVRAGISLSQALQDNDALTPTGHNLIRAGERAGQLPRMLRSLAKLLEESGRTRMKRFLLLIEPVAILTIGGMIGLIMAGVILAITSVHNVNF